MKMNFDPNRGMLAALLGDGRFLLQLTGMALLKEGLRLAIRGGDACACEVNKEFAIGRIPVNNAGQRLRKDLLAGAREWPLVEENRQPP
jgi:hypothetical protein